MQIEILVLLDEWIDDIHLSAQVNLLGDELVDGCAALDIVVKRMYWFAPRREFVDDTHMQVAIDSHRQCARDRGGSHYQNMGRTDIFLPEFGTLCHTKAVLLVNDAESEIGELHLFLDESMGADEDIDFTVAELLMQRYALFGGSGTREQFTIYRCTIYNKMREHFADTLIVLVGEDFGRCHDTGLVAIVHCE